VSQPTVRPALQHRTEFAPSPQAKRRSGRPAARVVVLALALTAFFLLCATTYIGAYARLTHNERCRQALLEQIIALQRANAQLQVQSNQLSSPDRLARIAAHHGLQVADPGKDVNFVMVPEAYADLYGGGNFLPAPASLAVAEKHRLVAFLSHHDEWRTIGQTRAEASTAGGE